MSLGTQEQRTEGMKKQAQELIEQAYQRGYKAGYSKAENDYHAKTEDDRQSSYELGLNMAWEAARKLVSMGYKECNEVLGDGVLTVETIDEIFVRCTAPEAIEKLRKYEEQKLANDIRVGDEVVNNYGDKGIVLCYYHETDSCGNYKEEWLVVYMSNYDVPQTVTKKRFKKTGKRYDVMSILKQMQEGEE